MVSSDSLEVGGLLLTGGKSRRMGVDKATLRFDGELISSRLARLLSAYTDPTLEVGPGYSSLVSVREELSGQGPMYALGAGWEALRQRGVVGSVLVLACDMPIVAGEFIQWLASHPNSNSVIPLLDAKPQPLCARWSVNDLAKISEALRKGVRSFKTLYQSIDALYVDTEDWAHLGISVGLSDIDSQDDIERLGLTGRIGTT